MTRNEKSYRRILVATDFSTYAEAAFRQAIWLARRVGASITLLHTVPDLRHQLYSAYDSTRLDLLYGEGEQFEEFEQEVRREADVKMRHMIDNANVHDLDVNCITPMGEPFVEIAQAVQEGEYDLVLAGTRGMAAWEQFFVGSTAMRLIRKCPSSVWIVKSEHMSPPKVVLATTDFSEVSRQAVLEGLWIASQSSAEFHLFHVIDSMDTPEAANSKTPKEGSSRNQINEQAAHRCDIFVKSLSGDPDTIHRHYSWGTPWKEISRLTKHLNVDLVVMGTVGRSGIKGLLLGNTAEKVLNTCDCSVLTVKPADFVSPIVCPPHLTDQRE